MQHTKVLAAFIAAVLTVGTTFADESNALFPFVIEKGAPNNITNVQTWSGAAPVAGANGFIFDQSGDFTTKKGQTRLLGTNFCFGASFTTKEKAERVADTLSRFGVGVVRLHHMDSRDIWIYDKEHSCVTTEIDPEKLDRLDYVIYCLKQKGIYVNINLHVSRKFTDRDGFVDADKLPSQDKGVDNFDRKMIEYQKKYAKELLQHVNPYTGLSYVDDPCVAVVEINNENSVVASWSWGQLDNIPEYYEKELQELWNKWLVDKYGTTEKLREAWACKSIPFGENMIDRGFVEGFQFKDGWTLEQDGNTKCKFSIESARETGIDSAALLFQVEQPGDVSWRPQFAFNKLKVEKDEPYLVSFKLRSKNKTEFGVGVGQAHGPWSTLGLGLRITGQENWTTVELPFLALANDDKVRLSFSGFKAGAEIELADVSIRHGGEVELSEKFKLEDGAVPVPKKKSPTLQGPHAKADFSDFLHDLENGYWQEMYKYVKSLGVKSLVTGTQLQYGFWYNQGRLDYCDIHAYWNHPDFPRRSWDSNDWTIKNTCLANSPANGTLANLASLRVLGKPFTCSEYDHPYPNEYCAEGNVMLAAVAAFQDWSATFQFAWSHGDEFERQAASPFFDECSQTVKIAHLPACYGMFVRGDVKSGPGEYYYAPGMTEEGEKEIMSDLLDSYHRSLATGLNLDTSLSLAVYSGVDLTDLKIAKSPAIKKAKKIESWKDLPERMGAKDKKEIVNEFGEITWNYQEPKKGWFKVDTANTKAFSGFTVKAQEFDGMTLSVGKTIQDWSTVTLVKAKNATKDAKKSGRLTKGSYLLTATGAMRNADMKTIYLDNEQLSTAGHFGGSNGNAPVLCEGINATVTLDKLSKSNVEVYALTNSGDRGSKLEVKTANNGCQFTIGPEYKTIWYEVVVK